ncbi:MAG: tetratricopeptide repeat protein [bacterium]
MNKAAAKIVPAGLFVLAFGLYAATAAPEFLFDDNPEFIASSHVLGVTHPPGYALFSLAGKLFTALVPAGTAFSVNLVSVFFGALAVTAVYFLLAEVGCRGGVAAAGAVLLGVSRTFWSQSVQAEVYSPNAFFTVASLWLVLRVTGKRDGRLALLLALVVAAGAVMHYSLLLLAPVFVVMLLSRLGAGRAAALLLPAVFAAAVCLSADVYLPLRSSSNPEIYWGSPDTWEGFVEHVRGVQTKRGEQEVPFADKAKFAADYARQFGRQFFAPLLIFILPGLAWTWRRSRAAALVFLPGFAVNAAVFVLALNYLFSERAVYVVSFFYIPSYFLAGVFLVSGVEAAMRFLNSNGFSGAPVYGVFLLLAAVSAGTNWRYADRRGDTIAHDYGMNILDTVERDGVVFAPIEVEAFPIACLRTVANQRRDVRMYGHHGARAADVYAAGKMDVPYKDAVSLGRTEALVLTGQTGRVPVYYTLQRPFGDDPRFRIFADGLVYRVNPRKHEIFEENPWDGYRMRGISWSGGEHLDYVTRSVVTKYGMRRAEGWLQRGETERALALIERVIEFNPRSRFLRATAAGIYLALGDLFRAGDEYEKALDAPPEHVEVSVDTVAIHTNLSFIYGRMGRRDKALEMIRRAVELAPGAPELRVNLGKTYWHMGDCGKAVAELEKAVGLGHMEAPVFNILGICYEQLGDAAKAERMYMKSVSLDPGYSEVYRDAGVFYAYKKKDFGRAVAMLKRYLELEPEPEDRFDIEVTLGIMNRRLGRCAESLKHLDAALKLFPGAPGEKKSVISNLRGECLEELGRHEEALAEYEKAVGNDPGSANAHRNLGFLLAERNNDAARAAEHLSNYLRLAPGAEDRKMVESKLSELLKAMK